MRFSDQLKAHISDLHLLNHPFYQAWNDGTLEMERLQKYAAQYYWHVDAFPRYVSATHSVCENADARKVLLENLNDEEGVGATPHPELWRQFTDGLGLTRDQVLNGPKGPAIRGVIEQFSAMAKASYAEGLASLYAYEYQVPEVADSKIKGLKTHYGVQDPQTLSFFEVHKEADVFHREACERLLDQLSEEERASALKAARHSAQALWNFLTEMQNMDLGNAA